MFGRSEGRAFAPHGILGVMSRFTPETIERVRDTADIVEIVSAYTDLRRQGERFVNASNRPCRATFRCN